MGEADEKAEDSTGQFRGHAPGDARYLIMNYYDSLSRSFGELYGREQIAKYSRAIRAEPHGRVLDVGCGIGLLYGYLAKKLRTIPELYVGIDLSFESLRKLRSRYGKLGLVEVLAADAEYPPLRGKLGFTHIYSFTLYTCDYGDIGAILGLVDPDFTKKVVLTLMCSSREPRCPEGFSYAGHLSRVEILCVRSAAGGI